MSAGLPVAASILRFGPFELDRRSGELRKRGCLIKLQDQPFQLLLALLEHPGEVVLREELRRRLWSDETFVGFEDGLNTAIRRVRDALGDSADSPAFIETLPRRGYRFVGTLEPAPAVRLDAPGSVVRGAARHRLALWAGVAVVAGVAMSAAWLVHRAGAAGVAGFRSIAVLPLENLSAQPGEEYLADGITDQLITDLANISSLRVIPRGSVMQYKGARKSLPEIGRQLNVDVIVEGTVARSGDRVRVTAQLIEAAADRHLWAESYERDVRDLLALQREVAAAIAARIQATLTARERSGLMTAPRVNPDAYLAYIKGRVYWNQRTQGALEKGVASFQQSIDIDPGYAPAYAGLADCYTALGYGSYLPPKVAFERARAAAIQALVLDGELADPHASLGYVKLYYDWDFAGAEREFQRAIALNPNSVTAHQWYSVYLTAMGRFEEARREIRRAQQLDPFSPAINTDVGFVEYYSGRYPEAVKQLRATLDPNPSFPLAHLWLGRAYEAQQRHDEAVSAFTTAAQVLVDWPVTMAALGHVFAVSGRHAEARRMLDDLLTLSTHKYVTPYGIALVYDGLGDTQSAAEWLDRAVSDRSNWLVWLKLDQRFENLRRSPRFDALVRRVGLSR